MKPWLIRLVVGDVIDAGEERRDLLKSPKMSTKAGLPSHFGMEIAR